MRATRGLLASLGAGTCLILAGSAALTFVSAFIGFHGWPGLHTETGADQRALVALVTRDQTSAAPVSLRLRAPERRAAPVNKQVATAGPSAPVRVGAPVPARQVNATAVQPSGRVPVTSTPPTITTPSMPPPPGSGENVRKLGTTIQSTVGGTGQVVAQLVKPVVPVVATTVQNTTDGLGQLLGQVTAVVGQVVDNLGPPPAP